MKRIFGTKKEKPPPPSLDEATDKLTGRGDALDKKINMLEQQLAKFRDQIKRSRGPAQEGLKRRALQVLKQKRMYEQQRDQLYNQQFTLEQAAFTAQQVKDSVDTVQALKQAQKELKTQFKAKELDITSIDKLNDQMADMYELNSEIQEALGRNYDLPEDIDESELMDELDALDAELSEQPDADGIPSYLQTDLPDAPSQIQEPSDPVADPVGLPERA